MADLMVSDVDAIIAGMLKYPDIGSKAAAWLTMDIIDTYSGGEPVQPILVDTIRFSFADLKQTSVEAPQLVAVLPHAATYYLSSHPGLTQTADEIVAACLAALETLANFHPSREMVQQILAVLYDEHVKKEQVQAAYQEYLGTDDWQSLMTKISTIDKDSNIAEGAVITVDPFAVLDEIDIPLSDSSIVEAPRLLTGTVLDTIHNGKGMYRGFMSLLLGPTSGGKTIMANNLVASAAAFGLSVGFIPTEESLSDHIEARARLLAACSEVTVDEWLAAGCDVRRLATRPPKEQLDRLSRIRKNCTFYEVNASMGWHELAAMLEASAATMGKMHELIVLDWAGPLSLQMMSTMKNVRDQHVALEMICHLSKDFAKKYNTTFLIMHQLAAEVCEKKGIFGKYLETDSQNCKKMAQYAAAVYVLSPRDLATDRGRLIGAKTRFDKKGFEIVVHMNYQRSRFEHLDNYVMSNTHFSKVGGREREGIRMAAVRNDE